MVNGPEMVVVAAILKKFVGLFGPMDFGQGFDKVTYDLYNRLLAWARQPTLTYEWDKRRSQHHSTNSAVVSQRHSCVVGVEE